MCAYSHLITQWVLSITVKWASYSPQFRVAEFAVRHTSDRQSATQLQQLYLPPPSPPESPLMPAVMPELQ